MIEQTDMFALDAQALAEIAARPAPEPKPVKAPLTVQEDYEARVAAGTIRPVFLDAPAYCKAPPRRGRTYGMTFYNFVVKICPRCGATPDFAGAIVGSLSWAHQCEVDRPESNG